MPETAPDPFAAEMISNACHGLAAMVARRMTGDHATPGPPSAAVRPFVSWKDSTAGRLQFLVAALESGSPGMFIEQITWAKVAFATRGVPADDFRTSLVALRDVLATELPEQARPSAVGIVELALQAFDRAPDDLPPVLNPGAPHGRLAAGYLLKLLEGDRRAAADLILASQRAGLAIADLYLRVLLPAQGEIGLMWHRGEVTVAEEHFATATTHMVMSMLYPTLPRRESNHRTVICGSVQGNTHDIGIRMVADFFEIDGWRSVYLGADMPAGDLAQAVEDFRADALCLSAGLAIHLRHVRETIETVRAHDAARRVKVLVGGTAFGPDPAVWKSLGADGFTRSADEAPRAARALLGLPA